MRMKQINGYFLVFLAIVFAAPIFAQSDFQSSLHNTRNGKSYWYSTVENGGTGGFETLTGVPIEDMGCKECHGPTNAKGEVYPADYEPSCDDCHATDFSVSQDQCLSCHSRQKAEITVHNLPDVHREEGFKCWDCHGSSDIHGDGTEYQTMFETGAIGVDCIDCHNDAAGTLPNHSSYDPHNGALHCNACHTRTVIACYNCHMESQVEDHLKRPLRQIKDFVLLVNREKDGKVGTASFQSITYQGDSWIAIGPYQAHSIMSDGRKCNDCHANFGGTIPAIQDYNDDGIMQFAKWNEEDSSLVWLNGVVAIPADYEKSFKLDFITYNGNTSDPVGPSKNWSIVDTEWDGHQMLFATPLTTKQMASLGFDTTVTSVKQVKSNLIPEKFGLEQNYPNPFNPSTTIKYSIANQANVQLQVFDAIGNLVETLIDKAQTAGVYTVEFTAKGISSGVYYYQLKTDNFKETKKFVLMK